MRVHGIEFHFPFSAFLFLILCFPLVALLTWFGVREEPSSVEHSFNAPRDPEEGIPSAILESKEIEPEYFYSSHAVPCRSRLWAIFEQYARELPREDLLRLVDHRSPVVRAHAASYISRNMTTEAAALYPLLFDTSAIEERLTFNVFGWKRTISSWMMCNLCESTKTSSPVQEMLLRAAVDESLPDDTRAHALRCVAPWRKPEAISIARRFLRDEKWELRQGGVFAFFGSGSEERGAVLAAHASETEPSFRQAVATLLGNLSDPRAIFVLRKLIQDPIEKVRAAAVMSCARYADQDPQLTAALLKGENEWVRESILDTLTKQPTRAGLRVLGRYIAGLEVRERDSVAFRILWNLRQHRTKEVDRFVRTVFLKLVPNYYREWRSLRALRIEAMDSNRYVPLCS